MEGFVMERAIELDDILADQFKVRGVFAYRSEMSDSRELIIARWYHDKLFEFHFFVTSDRSKPFELETHGLSIDDRQKIASTLSLVATTFVEHKTHAAIVINHDQAFVDDCKKKVQSIADGLKRRIFMSGPRSYVEPDGKERPGFFFRANLMTLDLKPPFPKGP